MITQGEARRIISAHIGSDDITLIEFPAGWMLAPKTFGGATLVVERSGALKRFPSAVPPERVQTDYRSVAHRGHKVEG